VMRKIKILDSSLLLKPFFFLVSPTFLANSYM
jgi:hypothetical protein